MQKEKYFWNQEPFGQSTCDNYWSFIDKHHRYVFGKYLFLHAKSFKDGFAPVCLSVGGFGWLFIDSNGNFIGQPMFVSADNFSEGLAAVSLYPQDDQHSPPLFGFVDKNANWVIQPKYLYAKSVLGRTRLRGDQVIGAGPFNGLSITANNLASVAIDHYGFLNMPPHALRPFRVVGAVLMVAGITLIARF